MAAKNAPALRRGPGRPRGPEKVMVPLKMTPEQRKRFKTLCAAEGGSYADWVVKRMDAEEAKLERARRAQAHPLHQPTRKSAYPGGGV